MDPLVPEVPSPGVADSVRATDELPGRLPPPPPLPLLAPGAFRGGLYG